MFTDELRRSVWDQIRQIGLRGLARYVTSEVVQEAAARAGIALGGGPLNVFTNVWLTLGAAWHASRSFGAVLPLVVKLLGDAPGFAQTPLGRAQKNGRRRARRRNAKTSRAKRFGKSGRARSKHDPRRDDPTQVSGAAFAKARERIPWGFWMALLMLLGERFQQQHGRWVRWKGFRLLALDGTTLKLPRFRALARYFDTARNGSATGVPRARMLLLQFPLTRMPFRYELVPYSEAEVTVAERLVKHLQAQDLLLLDRGFWSYGLMARIVARSAHFGIRLKAGVKLKTVRKLGPGERLVRWNVPARHRQTVREAGLPESLLLRVIDYQVPGFRPSAVLTSVTDPQAISRQDWVRLATQTEPGEQRLGLGLYHRRWEIETTFRELKVHQGMKRLRSRTPASLRYEVAGHVLLYLLIRWMIVEAAERHGIDDPLRLSFCGALEELNHLWPLLVLSPPRHVSAVLRPCLLERIAGHRVRCRPGRHFPRPQDTQPKNKGNGHFQKPSKLTVSKG